jgi:hypothetical protein
MSVMAVDREIVVPGERREDRPKIDLVCDLRRAERKPAGRLVRRSAPVPP